MKNDLNSVLVEGSLVTDPLYGHGEHDKPVCHFTIRCNRLHSYNDKYRETASYFNIIAYNGQAEVCNERLREGHGVRVVGRLSGDTLLHIIAEHVEFKTKKA